eukprot:SAG11_NODE_8995_length_955_cov_1.886682_1_plen_198_part_00
MSGLPTATSSALLHVLLMLRALLFIAASTDGEKCLSAISDDGGLIPDVATASSSCAGQDKSGGWFSCGGVRKLIQVSGPNSFLGMADFTVNTSMQLALGKNNTAASVQFLSPAGQETVGLDGDWNSMIEPPSNAFFLGGPAGVWGGQDGMLLNVSAPPTGVWFNLTIARSSGMLAVSLNSGKPLFSVPMNFTVSGEE